VTGESLADPELICATSVSLLQRLRDAVNKAEEESRRCTFTLWSPWPFEPGSLLAEMIDSSQGALRLNLLFEGKTAASVSGALRKCWAENLGLAQNDEQELRRILRPLRFRREFRAIDQFRSELSDILPLGGLQRIQDHMRADVYPALIQRLHREGRRWFGPAELIEICKAEGLWVGIPDLPQPITQLGIRSLIRFAESLEDETEAMICLTEFFSGRQIREHQFWESKVLHGLQEFLGRHLSPGGRYRIHLPVLTSVAVAAGYLSEPKLGAHIEIKQPSSRGTEIWTCGVSENAASKWILEYVEFDSSGSECGVAISVARPTLEAVRQFVNEQLREVKYLLHLTLPNISGTAIEDAGHAVYLANTAARLIETYHASRGARDPIHVFAALPNAMAFMLGQHLRPLSIALYEFDFERSGNRTYSPSLVLTPHNRLCEAHIERNT
jgi:hypothetical protein